MNALQRRFNLSAGEILVVNACRRELSRLKISFQGTAAPEPVHIRSLSSMGGIVIGPLHENKYGQLIIKEVCGAFRGCPTFFGEMGFEIPTDEMARILLTYKNPSGDRLSKDALKTLSPFSLDQISLTYSNSFSTNKRAQTQAGVIIKNNSRLKVYDVVVNHLPTQQQVKSILFPCLKAGEEEKVLFGSYARSLPYPQTIRLKLADGVEFVGRFDLKGLTSAPGQELLPQRIKPRNNSYAPGL